MKILQSEIEARERSVGASSQPTKRQMISGIPPTAHSLTTGTSNTQPTCVYCSQAHPSLSCQTVREPEERKRMLRTSGRCFVCLRRNHVSRNCQSSSRCATCHRKHHTSICSTSTSGDTASVAGATISAPQQSTTQQSTTSTMSAVCVGPHTPILLQTAMAKVRDARQHDHGPTVVCRAIHDTGSQRSYATARARKSHTESLVVKAFGSERRERRVCDVIHLQFAMSDDEPLVLPLVVVPHICDPVSVQPIDTSKNYYKHLAE